MKTKSLLFYITLILFSNAFAQDTLSVLFLGNSYTSYNNLPQLVQSISSAAGKTLIIDSNMPGGYTVSGHVNDPNSINKISQGNWDYVVIQEQSQIPTIDYYRYNDMYPAMADLKFLVTQFNPCAKIITYMTWGRRFGGQQCDQGNVNCSPVFTNFNHMQDSLTSAYTEISDLLSIQCAPVGVTWQNILNDTSLVLHSSDNSHPNLDGSYVTALTLFSSIWKKTSAGISYTAGLSATRAQYYQSISDQTVFSTPDRWNLNINKPIANFTYLINGNTATFINSSLSATSSTLNYLWNFGDGNTSFDPNPVHTYNSNGSYNMSLIVSDCIFSDTVSFTIQTGLTTAREVGSDKIIVYPNPFKNQTTVNLAAKHIGSEYYLYNILGEMVYSGKVLKETFSMDLSDLKSGIYFLTIGENSFQSYKLIKE